MFVLTVVGNILTGNLELMVAKALRTTVGLTFVRADA